MNSSILFNKFAILSFLLSVAACNNHQVSSDASGTFEADEVVVSAELAGRLLSFIVEEGDSLAKGAVIGSIDAVNLELQKEQVAASIDALSQRTADVSPQVKLLEQQLTVQQSQLNTLQKERQRTENLLKQDAATGKQLDDINAQIDLISKQITVTHQQINVQRSNTGTQNRSILSEGAPLQKRVAQLEDQLKKASIQNPVPGTVLTSYAAAGEVVSAGKALYKIADLSQLYLRAYITSAMLSEVKIGQDVTVLIDQGKDDYKKYPGRITWISDKAEFTPKTIQTKEERANLVYALKIKVKNDGFLKIGMYGEVQFKTQE